MKHKVIRKLRARRDMREFQRALDNASPSMRQELLSIAAHNQILR